MPPTPAAPPPEPVAQVDDQAVARRELITPEWARHMITHRNTANRPILNAAVMQYAVEMAAGEWESWIPIAIDVDGSIADGQHRLAAVVQHGKPVSMLVLRGVPSTYKVHIDRGRKRNPGFQLALAGFTTNVTRFSSIIRIVCQIDNDWISVPDAILRKTAERDRAEIHWAVDTHFGMSPGRDPARTAPVVAAFIYAYPVSPEKVDEFARIITTRVGMTAKSPTVFLDEHLRNIVKHRGTEHQRKDTTLRCLRALHVHIQGEEMARLAISEASTNFFRTERARLGKL